MVYRSEGGGKKFVGYTDGTYIVYCMSVWACMRYHSHSSHVDMCTLIKCLVVCVCVGGGGKKIVGHTDSTCVGMNEIYTIHTLARV